jgi:putative peptidoglycan lipid II flippase
VTSAADAGLSRSVRLMAVGTAASRLTGFLRTAVIGAVLGVQGLSLAYNVANTAPNIVYDLLLGGVLSAVVVPLLVRAAQDDADGGTAYAQRLLTLVVLALGAASVLLVVAAPLVVDLYLSDSVPAPERHLAVVFTRYFLPQVLFYGAGAVVGAALNTRGRFAAPMWAPVLNNLVVIATGIVFFLLPGGGTGAGDVTGLQVVVLGTGTTLGVIAQTVALLPPLRRAGIPLRPRTDFRGTGLGTAARLARWVFLYVVANQVAYLVVVRLASDAFRATPDRSYASFTYAYILWQLPHAVVAVSVITGLLPRMSRAAAEDRLADLRASLNRGLRLTVALLVPATAAFVVLGGDIGVLVFGRGNTSVEQARFIGVLLAVFAVGLVPFSAYQLQLRAFYALQDTRTPFFVNVWVNLAVVAADLLLYAVLPDRAKVVGLAAGQSLSFVVGLAVCSRTLGRRLGGLDSAGVVPTAVRCLLAVLLPAALAALAVALAHRAAGTGAASALLALAGGAAVLGAGYLVVARALRVPEVGEAVGPVLRRLHRA